MSEENQKNNRFFIMDRYTIVMFIVVIPVISIAGALIPPLRKLLEAPDDFLPYMLYALVRGAVTMSIVLSIAYALRGDTNN